MIKKLKRITVYLMALFYTFVGVTHFTNPDFFLVIVPPYIPSADLAVYVSGVFEILFGLLLLFNKTRKYSAYGLVLLLIAVFPANLYLYESAEAQAAFGITAQQALIRLPFQLPLILIALWHSEENTSKVFDWTCLILFIPTFIYFISLG